MKRALWVVLLVPLLGACDLFGPSGPGSLTARVVADTGPVGAAVLRVGGEGVTGFSSAGGSRIFTRKLPDPGQWRLVVVNPDGGELAFRIDVEDVAGPAPSTLVFSAADASDEPMGGEAGVRVVIDQE